ncbi:succinate dehydrogenase [uncultured Thiodictyon sp.]|uniref:succinate dehydrogenase n=1 Tax=uncultured Thiodictyon sp. TaxID=1846217 RepID=UPI0025E84368|nr:succinate dehydrogenase [uncultured Thiodictyon sp.]
MGGRYLNQTPAGWAFRLHRLSGLALTLFLPVHFCLLSLALTGPEGLEAGLAWTHTPLVRIAELVLIALLSLHLAGGLRLLAIEFLGAASRQLLLLILAWLSCGVVVLLAAWRLT